MDDETRTHFMSITGASSAIADQYLRLADSDLNGAIELFFANDGADLEAATQNPSFPAPRVPSSSTRPPGYASRVQEDAEGVIHIASDDEDQMQEDDDDDAQETGVPSHPRRGPLGSTRTAAALHTPPTATPPPGQVRGAAEDDEAMARRLQEEFYGGGGGGTDANGFMQGIDAEGYRAPIQRTTETLVGPDSFDSSNAEEMNAAILEQMQARRLRPQARDRPGIFNQSSSSIWNDSPPGVDTHRNRLSRATGGASDQSAKANALAEMYRPPFELMARLSWDEARNEGKENLKWILMNIQDPSIFDCQLLNRDIWKNPSVAETIRENFIFLQFSKDDPRAIQYLQYYFPNKDVDDAYPHIAIVDPRTGEQVKVWSGPPSPKALDFLMQLHEFLDRYSLNAAAKNPIARRKPEIKKSAQVDRMTEEQQMEMAMQASLAADGKHAAFAEDSASADPDDLTRSMGDISNGATDSGHGKGKGRASTAADSSESSNILTNGQTGPSRAPNGTHQQDQQPPLNPPPQTQAPTASPFTAISSSHPHTEPSQAEQDTTRIQFRHPNGRVVRRFSLADPVRRIYEWLKASPIDESFAGKNFELVFMQRNLIASLDESVEQAGLKNGTVMVELLG